MTTGQFFYDMASLRAEIAKERCATTYLSELIEQIRKLHVTNPGYTPDHYKADVDALLRDLAVAYSDGWLERPDLKPELLEHVDRITAGSQPDDRPVRA